VEVAIIHLLRRHPQTHNPQVITTGTAYMELGATASDDVDGDATASIVIDASTVDSSIAGSYQVTYDVQDAAGNAATTVTRMVTVENPPPPAAPTVTLDVDIKKLIFSWAEVSGATHYILLENPDGHSGFTQVGADIPAGTLSVTLTIAVHFQDFANALYMVEACHATGCTGSTEVNAMNGMLAAIGYFKASNSEASGAFGLAVTLSADGSTLAVGANDASSATGINGDQSDTSAPGSGAVFMFRFDGTAWSQHAYIKASNTGSDVASAGDRFGGAVALSADGNTLAVGARNESSNATGVNGDQNDNSTRESGAVYVFRFDGTAWSQQAYVKASNTDQLDRFGGAVALSTDGNTLAVGAAFETSNATGINGDQSNTSACCPGAVYLFRFDGTDWFQQAYVKASNTDSGDQFGTAVALSANGDKLAVGAVNESSIATGINGEQNDESSISAGAVYVFRFDGTAWSQQAYVKASNNDGVPSEDPDPDSGAPDGDQFGGAVALSADGNSLAVGAAFESSNATGINGDQTDNSSLGAGAVYMFRFDGTAWFQQAYIKASITDRLDRFSGPIEQLSAISGAVALSTDGNTLAVGARYEASIAAGINGDQNDNSATNSGAVYIFRFDGTAWSQHAYVKASNTGLGDFFGWAVALSGAGNTLAVGGIGEASNATGINGDQNDNSRIVSGAVYLY